MAQGDVTLKWKYNGNNYQITKTPAEIGDNLELEGEIVSDVAFDISINKQGPVYKPCVLVESVPGGPKVAAKTIVSIASE